MKIFNTITNSFIWKSYWIWFFSKKNSKKSITVQLFFFYLQCLVSWENLVDQFLIDQRDKGMVLNKHFLKKKSIIMQIEPFSLLWHPCLYNNFVGFEFIKEWQYINTESNNPWCNNILFKKIMAFYKKGPKKCKKIQSLFYFHILLTWVNLYQLSSIFLLLKKIIFSKWHKNIGIKAEGC